jgi:hypothetical protein
MKEMSQVVLVHICRPEFVHQIKIKVVLQYTETDVLYITGVVANNEILFRTVILLLVT